MTYTETVEIGSSPVDEPCAQVGEEGYGVKAYKECNTYKAQLNRFIEQSGKSIPEDFKLVVKGNSHDFGTYYEVICRFDGGNESSWDLANFLVNEGPTKWDDQSKLQLGVQ